MLYNLRHSAAAARFLVTLSCDGRGVEGEANRGDQETRERESDEQQKKAPSEMGKTGLGLKKMRREEGKEGGQSLSLSLSLSSLSLSSLSGPEQTLWAIQTADGRT